MLLIILNVTTPTDIFTLLLRGTGLQQFASFSIITSSVAHFPTTASFSISIHVRERHLNPYQHLLTLQPASNSTTSLSYFYSNIISCSTPRPQPTSQKWLQKALATGCTREMVTLARKNRRDQEGQCQQKTRKHRRLGWKMK